MPTPASPCPAPATPAEISRVSMLLSASISIFESEIVAFSIEDSTVPL